MILKNGKRTGAVSTEVAISVTLSIVLLFVAVGLFNNNLLTVAKNASLSNLFNGQNSTKSAFSLFHTNYGDTEVNVQTMGEQGLGMLRQKANNLALTDIANYNNGTDTTTQNKDSIAYLTLAIDGIVGSPDICVYMKNPSTKPCKEDNIGGTQFQTTLSSSAVTLQKELLAMGPSFGMQAAYAEGSTNSYIVLTVSSLAGSLISSNLKLIPLQTEKDKYKFIQNITIQFQSIVYSQVLLVNVFNTFKSGTITPPNSSASTSSLSAALTKLLSDLKASVNSASNGCNGGGLIVPVPNYGESCCNGTTIGWPIKIHIMIGDAGHDCWVGPNEDSSFGTWADDRINDIAKSNQSGADLVNIIFNNNQINVDSIANKRETYTHLISHDHYNSTTSCDILKDGLTKINTDYKLNINIPTCNPSNWKTDDSDNP